MQEKIITLDKLANVLEITKRTMLMYTQSYLFKEFIIMDKICKPGRSFECKIILNNNSVPIIRKYLKIKGSRAGKSYVEKFDAFLGKEKQAL